MKDAEFNTLRAVGGFLVSGSMKNGNVQEIEIVCGNIGDLKVQK